MKGRSPKIKISADLDTLPGLQMVVFLYPQLVERTEWEQALVSLLIQALTPFMRALPSDLICCQRPTFQYHHMGLRISTYEFGDTNSYLVHSWVTNPYQAGLVSRFLSLVSMLFIAWDQASKMVLTHWLWAAVIPIWHRFNSELWATKGLSSVLDV